MSVKIVHAADFHLDSAFGALSAEQARQRRRESRELLTRLCNYVNQNGVDLVLLAGDLFDSDTTYRETLEALSEALGAMQARVFIAPGNHDPLTPDGPYARTRWSDNVHIFTEDRMQTITFPAQLKVWRIIYRIYFFNAVVNCSILSSAISFNVTSCILWIYPCSCLYNHLFTDELIFS